ncbi:uncharacterized protein LOC116611820 [Nematostella vectensis]|uniref:uncharacterized protein LOC116611820 n=1 Tax=Nematostella vectensis TaxID=45351 RepID=UPI0020776084|nr:uncharacterized protein LOC116611820 [Nematostella vectensis]
MRTRFRPNVAPRGRSNRSSGSSNSRSTPSTRSTNSSTASEQNNESDERSNDANKCSSTAESQDDAGIITSNEGSTKAIPTTTNDCKPGRRTRIKPAVTVRPRASDRGGKQSANKPLSKTSENITASKIHSVELVIRTCDRNDLESELLVNNKQTEDHVADSPEHVPFIPNRVKAANTPVGIARTNVISIHQSPQNSVLGPDDTTQPLSGSGSLISRRKRMLPNLVSASRRRRAGSVSKDSLDQGESPAVDVPVADAVLAQDVVIESEVSAGHSECHKRQRRSSEIENIMPAESSEPEHMSVEVSTTEEAASSTKQAGEDHPQVEQAVKKHEERRKKPLKHYKHKEPLDPSRMTLQDLIYFNPKENPMKSSLDTKRRRGSKSDIMSSVGDASTPPQSPSTPGPSQATDTTPEGDTPTKNSSDDVSLAPQVKIAEDGSIILDEESLLIRTSPQKSAEDRELVFEDSNQMNYAAYLKQRKIGRWGINETLKFYKALSQVGTDFSLMMPLFPKRTRKELKAKFKREEKLHRDIIDKALQTRQPIDIAQFAGVDETDEQEDSDLISVLSEIEPQTSTIGNTEIRESDASIPQGGSISQCAANPHQTEEQTSKSKAEDAYNRNESHEMDASSRELPQKEGHESPELEIRNKSSLKEGVHNRQSTQGAFSPESLPELKTRKTPLKEDALNRRSAQIAGAAKSQQQTPAQNRKGAQQRSSTLRRKIVPTANTRVSRRTTRNSDSATNG